MDALVNLQCGVKNRHIRAENGDMLLDGLVDGMTLNVTPYYVALDGTTVVYGETRTLVYRQWVGLEG